MRLASFLPARPWLAATLLLAPAALVLVGWPTTFARAAESLAFTLPDDDGYGVAECFAAGSACGQGMADGWCEAHGHVRAVAFGTADVTGSIARGGAQTASAAPGRVTIRCGD